MQKKDLEIGKLNQENEKNKQDNAKLVKEKVKQSQDIGNLEEKLEFLEEYCDEMKDTISKIQFLQICPKTFLDVLTNI